MVISLFTSSVSKYSAGANLRLPVLAGRQITNIFANIQGISGDFASIWQTKTTNRRRFCGSIVPTTQITYAFHWNSSSIDEMKVGQSRLYLFPMGFDLLHDLGMQHATHGEAAVDQLKRPRRQRAEQLGRVERGWWRRYS
jgi:hypothetical protein